MYNPYNQKKKKNSEEILKVWQSLKEKITRLVKHGIVYCEFKAPETITGQELLARKLAISDGYEAQLGIEREKYINLEKKLERVRNLVVGGEMQKLKSLIKRGEI